MSFCHQCGEQVASEDIYCPYCGISLTPVAGVDDPSMSETIVGIPASVLPVEAQPPKVESPADSSTNAVISDDAVPVTGNTLESVPFKTESVELPADEFESLKEAAFSDAPADSEPDVTDIADVPMPHLISEQAEPAALPKPSEALAPPQPDIEFIDSRDIFLDSEPKDSQETPAVSEDVPESLAPAENEAEVVAEPVTAEPFMSDPEPAESDSLKDDASSFSAPVPIEEISVDVDLPVPEPVAFVAPFEEPTPEVPVTDAAPFAPVVPVAETEAEPETAPDAEPVTEPEESAVTESDAEPLPESDEPVAFVPEPILAEPPIAMPEMPLLLENEMAATELDSVQIIQKQVADSLPKSVSAEVPAVSETPAENREPRPYTTPNIGKTDTDGRRSAKLKPLDEGTILNTRYEIVRKIGGGGMGAVYLANDRNLGGVLRAVKEMVQSYIESEQQDKAIADFKRESLLLTSLDHPAIPTIYDYFYDEKEARFYLVMKYISGGDLAGRLRAAPEGRIDEKSVTEWAIQIADVLHYLHTHEPSIVYRDLKPANVMIDGNSGRVMLIDFGIARWVNKEEKGVTAVGTMGYAPPELFSGNVEARSDIYSLGSTMFHLLTGADPQSNPLLIFDFQKNPRPRQINSQLSDQIEQILMRAVEYNADARFNSAGEIRDALKDHLNNLQTGKVTYGVKVAPSNRAFSEQLVFCGFCGKQIVATDVFCAFCGAQQPIAQQGVSQSSYAVQPMTAKLTLLGTGELEPSSFRLEKNDNLLGRRDPMSNIFPEVDLSKYDPQTKISRRHARVWREGNSFLVEDLGSSNGTTLLPSSSDSVRLLPHQPRTLTNGDKIRLGDTTLHFTIG